MSRSAATWRRSDAAKGLFLVSPTLLYAVLLLAAPMVMVVALSFWTQDFLELNREFTIANYREAWTEPIYQVLMLRSLKISALVTIFTLLLAFPIAYFISFHVPQKRKAVWIFLITIPFWTSYLVRIFLWKVILGFNGVVNGSLMGIGLISEPLSFILYNQNAVILTLCHAWVPFAILPIFVALERIDRSLLEAAEDLGDSPLRRFMRVTLPLAMPVIMLGLNQTIMFGIAMLVIAALVGTNGLGQRVYIGLGDGDFGVGIVAGIGMAFIAMIADRMTQGMSRAYQEKLGLDTQP